MKDAVYTDEEGRKWAVLLPDGTPDFEAPTGIPVGPPPLADLGLSEEFEIRLHNALFEARIFTPKDIRQRRSAVVDIFRGLHKMDAEKVYVHYLNFMGEDY